MKSILFLAMNLNSGGAERQMVTIATAMKEKGCDVTIVCYEEGDFFLTELENKEIRVIWLLKKRVLARLVAFRRFIKRGQYDVVISFLETPNILNCFAALGHHDWKVITGERSAKKELLTSFRGRFVAWLQRRTDALVCNSYNSASMWRQYYPYMNKKLTTIYNMVRISPVDYNIGSLDRCQKIKVVVAASYQYLKNPINVVKAIALLSGIEKNRLSLEWYGNPRAIPSAYEEMNSLIHVLHLEESITLHEATKDIHAIMCAADFIGLFSSVEGLPNAICEAMMLGKPIIFSKVSDYNNLVQGNGLLCDGNSPESIRDAFRKALSLTPTEIRTMGEKSSLMASRLFSKDIILNQWERLINS